MEPNFRGDKKEREKWRRASFRASRDENDTLVVGNVVYLFVSSRLARVQRTAEFYVKGDIKKKHSVRRKPARVVEIN